MRPVVYLIFFSVLVLPFIKGSVPYLHSIDVLNADAGLDRIEERKILVQQYLWTKAVSDLFLFLIVAVSFLSLVVKKYIFRIPKFSIFYIFLVFVLASFVLTFIFHPFLAIAGLRVFSPVVLFFIAYNYLNGDDFRKLGKFVIAIALISSILGFYQLFFEYKHYIYSNFYSIFSYPNSFGIFLTTAMAFLIAEDNFPKRNKLILGSIFSISIILTSSGAGLMGLGVLFGTWFVIFKRVHWSLKPNILLSAVFLLSILAIILPDLSDRVTIWNSFLKRLGILLKIIGEMDINDFLIGQGFGFATNAGSFLTKGATIQGIEMTFIADSMYTSLLSQIGIFGLLAYVSFNLQIVLLAYRKKSNKISKIVLLLLPLLLIQSSTTNIFEFFPINWIYWIMLAIFMKEMTISKSKLSYCDKNESRHQHPIGNPPARRVKDLPHKSG